MISARYAVAAVIVYNNEEDRRYRLGSAGSRRKARRLGYREGARHVPHHSAAFLELEIVDTASPRPRRPVASGTGLSAVGEPDSMAKIIHTTLTGQRLELVTRPELERLYDKILAASSGAEALALALGWDPLIKHPFTPMGRNENGIPSWSALVLQDPGWAYLQDAVALCRARHGELDVGSVMRSATWTVAEAARSLGVNEDAVRVAVRSSQLPAVQAEGRYLLNRRTVEAHETTGTRAGRTERVPALYVRAGTVGDAALVVHAVDDQGVAVTGELLGSVDGVDEIVIEGWARAVLHWGEAGKARAVVVKPAHGRAATRYAIGGLAVVGRVELLDKTNNRGEAAAMLDAFKAEIRRPRRG